jgi:hypothetical protein
MLIFKCQFSAQELSAMKESLPHDGFCIMRRPGEKMHYGVMREDLHSRFMDVLSGETLGNLEYLDEDELKNFDQRDAEITGNRRLIEEII